MTSKKQTVIFTLRLPTELHQSLKEISTKNFRSIAKEIEYRLEQSLKTERKL